MTHRTKLSEERSTLEVGRIGILNKTEVTNTQWLQTAPLEVKDLQFCCSQLSYAIKDSAQEIQRHFLPLAESLWHRRTGLSNTMIPTNQSTVSRPMRMDQTIELLSPLPGPGLGSHSPGHWGTAWPPAPGRRLRRLRLGPLSVTIIVGSSSDSW